jgi:DNA invertase Pin-like site-specific DNA recombinase/DNA-binding transcriptional MerR regulator
VSAKIQPTHLERLGIVYLRQSDPRQVRNHPESTARQYALKQRAVELGWPADRVEVIDEDLGQSATGTAWRSGFRRLAEEVGHGRVGAVFALEASRLARSNADWYRLLDLCGVADVVLIDEQSIYSPRNSDDRLLLGLKGAMSEAEQTWLRLRLHGGKLNKARRGALRFNACTGYVWDEAQCGLRFDPDERVQCSVRLIFERFRLDGSGYAVVRYFLERGLLMPGRDPMTMESRWDAPRYATVIRVLHNPIYAGAYVYGRRELRAMLVDGQVKRGIRKRAQDAWTVCLHDLHPAYISWEEFMANQRKLLSKAPPRLPDQSGAPRRGPALLQGLALCGRCGRRMTIRYFGRSAGVRYECRAPLRRGGDRQVCWMVSGPRIDEAVAELFLNTVQVPEIELGLEVVHQAEQQAAEIDKQWKLRLERARYDARLAERRYKAVDPDNRVVARSLEREWNEKLQELDAAERGHQAARQHDKIELSESDRARVLALAKDLRQVWNAEMTTHADRKNLLRMLVQNVTLSPIDVPERLTRIRVLWRTGAVSDFTIPRPKVTKRDATSEGEIVESIRSLMKQKTDAQIADELNRRGLRNLLGRPWTEGAIAGVRKRHDLTSGPRPSELSPPYRRPDGLYSLRGVAMRLDISEQAAHNWVRRGWLSPVERGGQGGARWFKLDDPTIARLQDLKLGRWKAPPRRSDGLYSLRGVAARLGVSLEVVRYWVLQGWLKPSERGGGHGRPLWFKLDPATISCLGSIKRKHMRRGRSHA